MSPDDTKLPQRGIPTRITQLADHPNLHIQWTDDGSRTLINPSTGIAYHSGCGAVTETHTVYLENSGVGRQLDTKNAVSVLEVGFGTGLGFLLTADRAIETNTSLRYEAIERDLLSAEVMESLAFDQQLRDKTLFKKMIKWRESLLLDKQHPPLVLSSQQETDAQKSSSKQSNVKQSLHIHLGEAEEIMNRWWLHPPVGHGPPFDVIYFDPFDPANNPDAWSANILLLVRRMLRPGGRLVSYCVNRQVRDRFASVGFHVYRVPGPLAGKREVLVTIPTLDGKQGNANLKLDRQRLQDLLEQAK